MYCPLVRKPPCRHYINIIYQYAYYIIVTNYWYRCTFCVYHLYIIVGGGSLLHFAQEMIVVLSNAIEHYKLQFGVRQVRLLDIPCGDMQWMSRFLKTRDDVDYTGVDIVPYLIESHKKTFRKYKSWHFVHADIVNNGTEIFRHDDEQFHIVLSRMMMQHLYNADVVKMLAHLSDLGSSKASSGRPIYLFATTFSVSPINKELNGGITGRFRSLNLEIPPVSLTPPLCIARDGLSDSPNDVHIIGLWVLPVSQVANCKTPATVNVIGFPFKVYSCVDWTI